MDTTNPPLSPPATASPNEIAILLLLTGQTFFLALTLSLIEIAGTALFLVDFGSEMLPYVYLSIAFFVSLLSYGYAELQKRWPLTKVATTAMTVFGSFCLLAWLGLIWLGWSWVSFGLMVMFALGYQMTFVVVGGQAGRLFNVRQMKRLFPMVLTGLTVGFMAGGLLLPLLTALSPRTENLLLAATCSMLFSLLLLRLTIIRFGSTMTQVSRTSSQHPTITLPRLLRKPYVKSIFFYQMLSAAGTQLVLFIFLDQTELIFPAVEDLAQFFGRFTIALNLIAILFLTAPAGFLLNRFGLRLGLVANPSLVGLIVLIMLGVGMTLGGGSSLFFWLAVSGRILDIVLSTGITAPSIKATYQAMPANEQPIVETAVEGIGVPIAFGLTGLALLLFNLISGFTLATLVIFTAIITAFWLASSLWVYRGYGRALRWALSRRMLGETSLTLVDGSSLAVVERLLQSNVASDVRLALDVLEAADHESVDAHLIRLLDHAEPLIRSQALARIGYRRTVTALPLVQNRLKQETNPTVKGAVLQALCALSGAEAVDTVHSYLDDPDRAVCLGAMVGLLQFGSIPGILVAGQRLAELEKATDPDQRAFVAQVIGQVGAASFYQPLQALLIDQVNDVRQAALIAAGQVQHPHLIPAIIDNLAQPALRSAAMAALIAYGETIFPTVTQALSGKLSYTAAITQRLVRATGQIQGERAITLLKQHLDHPDGELQQQILLALNQCRYHATGTEINQIEKMMDDNVQKTAQILLAKQDIGQGAALDSLQTALDDRLSQIRQQVFLLLSFIYNPIAMRQAENQLAHGPVAMKALVIETLDVTLVGQKKRPVLALVDDTLPLAQRVKLLGWPFCQLTQQERLHQIINNADMWPYPWIRACAIYAARQLTPDDMQSQLSLATSIKNVLPASDPYVQETANWALQGFALAVTLKIETGDTNAIDH